MEFAFAGYLGKLNQELIAINEHKKEVWIQRRIDQIKDYWQLDQFHQCAVVMRNVANEFRLEGNFTILEDLCDAVCIDKIYYTIH